MKSRVRRTMAMVLKSGGTAEGSLPAVDQKIYYMYPHNFNYPRVEDIVDETPDKGHSDEVSSDLPIRKPKFFFKCKVFGICHVYEIVTEDRKNSSERTTKSYIFFLGDK